MIAAPFAGDVNEVFSPRIVAANLKHEGQFDDVALCYDTPNGMALSIWLNTGSGPPFEAATIAPFINANGHDDSLSLTDIGVTPDDGHSVRVLVAITATDAYRLEYDGKGSFKPVRFKIAGQRRGGDHLAIGDLDGDRLPDLVLSTSEGVQVFRGLELPPDGKKH
jgi:hypothetical protein